GTHADVAERSAATATGAAGIEAAGSAAAGATPHDARSGNYGDAARSRHSSLLRAECRLPAPLPLDWNRPAPVAETYCEVIFVNPRKGANLAKASAPPLLVCCIELRANPLIW